MTAVAFPENGEEKKEIDHFTEDVGNSATTLLDPQQGIAYRAVPYKYMSNHLKATISSMYW
jgi:hypothetical protein